MKMNPIQKFHEMDDTTAGVLSAALIFGAGFVYGKRKGRVKITNIYVTPIK